VEPPTGNGSIFSEAKYPVPEIFALIFSGGAILRARNDIGVIGKAIKKKSDQKKNIKNKKAVRDLR